VLADLKMLAACDQSPVHEAVDSGKLTTSQLVVEDSRPGAGHMQVNHPAPMTGFFEPCVVLGQPVAAGELLGTITDVLGEAVESIHAAYGGIVLVLHTFSRVEKGTSVAVILDTAYSVAFA
jgi:predicted deacylase